MEKKSSNQDIKVNNTQTNNSVNRTKFETYETLCEKNEDFRNGDGDKQAQILNNDYGSDD